MLTVRGRDRGHRRRPLDVPASFSRATVTFSFTGTIRLPAGPVSWSIYANPAPTGPLVPT